MKRLSEINETHWGGMVRRSNPEKQVRKEDEYHPETREELIEIVDKEIKRQGGVNVNLRMVDVSNVEDMTDMFCNYSSLKSIDLSNWDVSNVTDMKYMFYKCESLQSLDLSNWDVSNVKNIHSMFDDCPIKYKKQGNKLVRI